jgi:hypothetical protein
MSTRSTTTFIVLLIIILGLAVGFWIAGLWTLPTLSPGSSSASSVSAQNVPPGVTQPAASAPTAATPGWCCVQRGSACTEEKEGAVVCLQKGGQLFNRSQQICDSICKRLQQK